MVRPVSNDPEFGGRYTASGIWIGPRKKAAPTQARTQAEAVARRAQSPTQAYLERYPTYVDANGQEQRNTWAGANNAARAMASYSSNPIAAPRSPGSPGGSSGGRGGGYGYGGGGGGGGGISAAAAAQAQIDALAAQLRSGMYTANAAPYDAMRKSVTDASAQDQAAASAAYNSLDTWLKQNNTTPYANVQLQRAQASPRRCRLGRAGRGCDRAPRSPPRASPAPCHRGPTRASRYLLEPGMQRLRITTRRTGSPPTR